MKHPVLIAIRRAAFAPIGWFAPGPKDQVPGNAKFVIMIGNAGPDVFLRFALARDPLCDSMYDWTREAVGNLARDLDAKAVYPFDMNPPWPVLTWARRGGAGHTSPLGLNIHPVYGLWHAYRAALLFPVAFDLPSPLESTHPCEACIAKPCLSACPVSAFTANGYDVEACAQHVSMPQGSNCMSRGCLARHACPVGQGFTYAPAQAQFHMRAFLKART